MKSIKNKKLKPGNKAAPKVKALGKQKHKIHTGALHPSVGFSYTRNP